MFSNTDVITMATIKSFTDLPQSKKLAEILPLESADMWWAWYSDPILNNGHYDDYPMFYKPICNPNESIPCWSLTALLGVLPKEIVCDKGIVYLEFHVWENSLEYVNDANYTLYVTKSYDNSVDACVDMIIKLREQNLL